MTTFTSEDYSPEDLLLAGICHLSAAKVLLDGDDSYPYFYDSAGYLAHLGLELMLKAWLLQDKGEFTGTHSLECLMEIINKSECNLTLDCPQKTTLVDLSSFEKLRYPNQKNPIEIGDEDIEKINSLAETILSQLPEELMKKYDQLPFGKKSGRVLMARPKELSGH